MTFPHPRARLARVLIGYFEGDDRRIDHALQVWQQAERLAEQTPGCDPEVLIAVALLHDVGIKIAEAKHGYNDGPTQEKYGPPVAEELLRAVGFPAEKISRVREIVGNHHSPSGDLWPGLKRRQPGAFAPG